MLPVSTLKRLRTGSRRSSSVTWAFRTRLQEAAVEGEDADDAKDKKSIAEVESLEEECDFCVYDDIRDKLIAKGITAEEIAYIHDAKTEQQKADLFDKVRSGEISVLLGSTAKMGTGTNVQKKADCRP